jgi:Flp pilus assembly protein TadD
MTAAFSPSHDADFDSAVLGGGLPPEAETLIRAAGLVRSDREQAEPLLLQARALAPMHPATLIALYRFHFYGHRLREAREIAKQSLDVARAALGDEFTITDEQARFDAATRYYLFSLKGLAYLSLRLGDIEAGRRALDELRQLDPHDRVGGGLLTHVLMRAESGDPADEAFSTPIAHRGWSQP